MHPVEECERTRPVVVDRRGFFGLEKYLEGLRRARRADRDRGRELISSKAFRVQAVIPRPRVLGYRRREVEGIARQRRIGRSGRYQERVAPTLRERLAGRADNRLDQLARFSYCPSQGDLDR